MPRTMTGAFIVNQEADRYRQSARLAPWTLVLGATRVAAPVVDADGTAARRADPPGVLDGHEPVQPHLTDPAQVLEHAHAVPGAVTQVHLSQSAAGVPGAVEAERSPRSSLGAHLDTADLTVTLFSSLHGQAPCAPVLLPQVGGTDPAVHPAGRHHQGGDTGRARRMVVTCRRAPQSPPRPLIVTRRHRPCSAMCSTR